MSRIASDLVRDSQLDTVLPGDGTTVHFFHVADPQSRRRHERVREGWRREREIGSGSFGHVWLERCVEGPKSGECRAVKEIFKPSINAVVDYTRELEAVAKFSQKKYVHCFVESFGWFESSNAVFIAMEYISNGDLQQYLHRPLPEPQAQEITSQLVEGLEYMHGNGFAHRDMKPSNILVWKPGPDWWVKIGDFGISKREEDGTALRTRIGTDHYLAPEVKGLFARRGTRSDGAFTLAVDIWALGEITHRMVTSRPVFSSRTLFEYVVDSLEFPAGLLNENGASQECRDFIARSMCASPADRWAIQQAKSHHWLAPPPESGQSGENRSRCIDSTRMPQSTQLIDPSSTILPTRLNFPTLQIPPDGTPVTTDWRGHFAQQSVQQPALRTSSSAYFHTRSHSHNPTATASWTDLSVTRDDSTVRADAASRNPWDPPRSKLSTTQPFDRPSVVPSIARPIPLRDQGILRRPTRLEIPPSPVDAHRTTADDPASFLVGPPIPPAPFEAPEAYYTQVFANLDDSTAKWTETSDDYTSRLTPAPNLRGTTQAFQGLRLSRTLSFSRVVSAIVVVRRAASRRALQLHQLSPHSHIGRSPSGATSYGSPNLSTEVERDINILAKHGWQEGWTYRPYHWGVASAHGRNSRISNELAFNKMELISLTDIGKGTYTLQSSVYFPKGLAVQLAVWDNPRNPQYQEGVFCKVARRHHRLLLYREAKKLRSMDHPAFPKILDLVGGVIDDAIGGLVFSQFASSSMDTLIETRWAKSRPLPLEVLEIFSQLLSGIDYLARNHHASHTQLTPSSILIAEALNQAGRRVMKVMITNLESWEGIRSARGSNTFTITELRGSPDTFDQASAWIGSDWAYLPPEKWLFSPPKPATKGTDLWSLGMILLKMHGLESLGPGPPLYDQLPRAPKAPYIDYLTRLPFEANRLAPDHFLWPWAKILEGSLDVIPERRMSIEDVWHHVSSHPLSNYLDDPTVMWYMSRAQRVIASGNANLDADPIARARPVPNAEVLSPARAGRVMWAAPPPPAPQPGLQRRPAVRGLPSDNGTDDRPALSASESHSSYNLAPPAGPNSTGPLTFEQLGIPKSKNDEDCIVM